MNKVMLVGRLGKDPELRYAANGSPIANLRIATDESYTDHNGNKVDRTEWHTVVVFQRQAENCATYLRKGSLVFVEGSLQTRKWQDQQGQDRYTTEVKAQRIQFLDRRGGAEAGTEGSDYDSRPSETAGHGGKQQQHRDTTLSDFDHAFSKDKGSAMDVTPWDMSTPQHQQRRNSITKELGRAFPKDAKDIDEPPF